MKINLKYAEKEVKVEIPEENFIYSLSPGDLPGLKNEEESIKESLRNPVSSAPLIQEIKEGMKIVILGDDITRPTPRRKIFPVLLDEINEAGVPDKDITLIIALGTHRYMSKKEIERCFGKKVTERVEVLNHEWKDESNFVYIGSTGSGIPVKINKISYESDYLIGVGNITPHCLAGYSGGAKIIQPGISSWEATARTHLIPAKKDNFLDFAGNPENEVRLEMEKVAKIAGLNFIINTVLNSKGEIVEVVGGDPVKAHRKGVEVAKKIYERKIPELADILILSAYPVDIDYWQAMKPLLYAQHGVRKNGTVIFLASMPEGISSVHSELEKYGNKSYNQIKRLIREKKIEDLVCAHALLQHTLVKERTDIICISEGLSWEQKEKMGFKHADSLEEALEIALRKRGRKAKIGVINYGGEVLPRLR
ncbi:nickel-dependent lactate racemase [Candidatus Aerophobetes bacterium]|nr:nickel-dependent lactate racemase [Candidatus Aerophobetes bacterium]